jgi:hypothetical protein
MEVVPEEVGGIPIAEDVTRARMPVVEVARVSAVEPMHRQGQDLSPALDEQVVVRAHEAVRVAGHLESGDDRPEQPEKYAAVVVVSEQRTVRGRPTGDVVEAVREMTARPSRHVADASTAPGFVRGPVRKSTRSRHPAGAYLQGQS